MPHQRSLTSRALVCLSLASALSLAACGSDPVTRTTTTERTTIQPMSQDTATTTTTTRQTQQ